MSNKKRYNYSLTINSSNVIGVNNNTFQYNFIKGSFTVPEEALMTISSVTIPYSWRNITVAYNNNSFLLYWPVGVIYNTYNITLPDGFYQMTDINYFLQQYAIANGLYLVNSSAQNVYYITFVVNSNYYAIQILESLIPTSLPSGWTQPSNWVGYPTTTSSPGIGILNNNFQSIIGFTYANYPSTFIGLINNSYLSNTLVNATPVNSLVLRCSLCNNPVTFPSDVLDAVPINNTYGSNILYNPAFEKNVTINSGTFSNFQLYLCDQNNNLINSLDPNLLITIRISYTK